MKLWQLHFLGQIHRARVAAETTHIFFQNKKESACQHLEIARFAVNNEDVAEILHDELTKAHIIC